ncbi:MAG: UDP-N-acetylmuramoyl-tripeptide--D-alanyl-D-alanine ligase [Bacteroidaceae bacterium]|nr:UDP-N-acetylmuramoyl-tripeptide--D-alanyl-D-alanine ligase [Bacteroidaceae bacterium]
MVTIEQLYEVFLQHPVITTDSRDCPKGSVFFALKGENFNGNKFAMQALERGCAYAVVDEPIDSGTDERILTVDNVLIALQQLARHHRRVIGLPVIGITGTNGKTTTKELIAAVLRKKYNILYTQGNFNNQIGVPKTVLGLRREHELAVIEMGASHPGDIEELVNISEPNFAIITNVGRAHLQGFGSFEGVIRTKGELYDFIRQHGGKVFINTDNPNLMGISQGLQLVPYSSTDRLVSCDPFLRFRWKDTEVQTNLIGAYNVDNLVAAATIGQYFGVSDKDICDALGEYVPSMGRSQFRKTERNRLVIDAYNANPTSMEVSLSGFSQMQMSSKLAILGDMKELGAVSREEHLNIIRRVRQYGIEAWLVGNEFAEALSCLGSESCSGVKSFADVESVKSYLVANPLSDRTILIKGSNSTRLHTLPDVL